MIPVLRQPVNTESAKVGRPSFNKPGFVDQYQASSGQSRRVSGVCHRAS